MREEGGNVPMGREKIPKNRGIITIWLFFAFSHDF